MASSTHHIRKVSFEDFDPNKAFGDKPSYALYDGYKFRTYAERGHCLNAFAAAPQAKVYEQLPSGHWSLVAVKHRGMRGDDCDLCGKSVKDSFAGSWSGREEWQWQREPSGKVASPLRLFHVCKMCVKDVRYV